MTDLVTKGGPTPLEDPADYGCTWDDVQLRVTRRRKRRAVAKGTGVAVLAVATLAGTYLYGPRRSSTIATGTPLALTSGAELASTTVLETAGPVDLSDGSQLVLSPSSRLAVVENTSGTFHTRIERGSVNFDVVPTPATRRRAWYIEASGVSVRVIGTRFQVEQLDDWVYVRVERGVVRVSGSTVVGGSTELTAGESIRVAAVRDTPARRPQRVPIQPSSASETEELPSEPNTVSESPEPAASDILARSDRLRRQGSPRAAARLLQEAIAGSPAGSEVPIWAFTLGQIQLDSLGQPAAAARSFSRARRRGLPSALWEPASARIVEAWARAGEFERSKAAAQIYLSRYPAGSNRAIVLRWLQHADRRP